jgi:hypothetical protein
MKTMIALAFAGLLGVSGWLVLKSSNASYRCSLTGETVAQCCCVEKEGSLYCTRAETPVEECCCERIS